TTDLNCIHINTNIIYNDREFLLYGLHGYTTTITLIVTVDPAISSIIYQQHQQQQQPTEPRLTELPDQDVARLRLWQQCCILSSLTTIVFPTASSSTTIAMRRVARHLPSQDILLNHLGKQHLLCLPLVAQPIISQG
ncbi:hypothetical protein H106_08757, partial [Trichophyton rubrum CBS 735.88]